MGTLIGLALAYLALLGFKIASAWRAIAQAQTRARESVPRRWRARDVAVLQPILSGDPALAQRLAANLLHLPEAHFHWLVDEDDAVAIRIALALQAAHPAHHIHVSQHPPAPAGINPKTFKLAAACAQIQVPICLVLDDDAELTATALAQLCQELDRYDLVTALPYYRDDATLPGQLLAQFTNNNAALAYLPLLPWTEPISINGMTYALRRSYLRQLGDFTPLLHHLTDDLAMADAVRAQGGRLCQSLAPVAVSTTVANWRGYVRQMHRWMLFATLLLRRRGWGLRAVIVVLQGLPPWLLWALLVGAILTPEPGALAVLLGVLALRLMVIVGLQRRLTGAARHRPLLSLLSELLQPLHLLHAALVRTIRWRTRRYRVHDNDRFTPV